MLRRGFALILLALGLASSVDAQRLIVTDSGSVEREVKRLFVVDSGGTSREIQRLFVIDSGGTARLVYEVVSTVNVPGGNVTAQVNDPSTVTVGVRFQRDGEVERQQGIGFDDWHAWHVSPSATVGDDFEVRATLSSGDPPTSGTLDEWLPLTGTVTWTVSQSGLGTRSSTLNITVREKDRPSNSDSGVYTLTAIVIDPN